MLWGIIKSMRPRQWVKNLFVLAPAVFSANLTDLTVGAMSLVAMGIFCMLSGAVYLMNDVFDVEKDRAHPVKKNRPVASGKVPLKVAAIAAGVIALGSMGGGFVLDVWFGVVAVAYFVVNAFYSSFLKHVVFVDVITIALGFLLRTMAGAFAIDVAFSEWLFGCTFLLALYLALGKRKHEILQAGSKKGKQRKVLNQYKLEWINYALLSVAGLTIAAYTAYALSISLPEQPWHRHRAPFTSPWAPATIPFAVLGIMRFFMLISKREAAESPTERMLRDIPFLLNLGAWGVAIVLMVYL